MRRSNSYTAVDSTIGTPIDAELPLASRGTGEMLYTTVLCRKAKMRFTCKQPQLYRVQRAFGRIILD